ncbi:MAG: hypothetical protein QS721_08680 [Candidatus Endonucleobacter sp. (ex Gigantidas childressi)]|nr:hypothetical protein [Candidatus Endonucleobacter sp. (ex Gigantidas childressi)]
MNHLIKNNWRKISGDLYDYLKDSQIVITSASGTAVEAIAMGVSVILVGEKDSVISNPMMPLGKDKMWGISLSSEELPEKINTLLKFRKENKGQIIEIAKLYRENLFNNPSPHEIKEMFEL